LYGYSYEKHIDQSFAVNPCSSSRENKSLNAKIPKKNDYTKNAATLALRFAIMTANLKKNSICDLT